MAAKRQLPEGISLRHTRACSVHVGGDCDCRPTYQAQVFSARHRRRLSRSFPTPSAARNWRRDALVDLRRGTLTPGRAITLRQAAAEWESAAEAGVVRNRAGDAYKPSTLRGYRHALEQRLLPALGAVKLADIRRADVQRLVARMLEQGLDPSTIRNTLMPLRAIYRRALALDDVAVNPTGGLQLPAVRGRRDRIAAPAEGARLIAALGQPERALWATAMYAGLRHGELLALRWEHVDVATGVIRVVDGFDPKAGKILPKSRAGRRSVPIAAALRDELLEYRMRAPHDHGLVFGRTPERPFNPSTAWDRGRRAWKAANANRKQGEQPLEPIGLHECRHTFASLMIAAGVNAKALSTFMGHTSVAFTLDRYGHLFPGSEDEAAELLDAYLERANTQARLAALGADA